ncbi:hypothetical protein SEVIR_9G371100v4 [Setaria viridis]|uniref:Uncharacterized protein n=1 Tax=Setaria viridis TaxID=4556 RepID=A0A4U6T528_SETVI|nr:uncharacterized protein LOC117839540 [Setaria viridis]XP_034575784.1 uncharacterized protein LOC117839540 [Setaria viridis]TKV95548.1 hypothetical protein SEVIR_9G371100v2 [Setaria viridis]TKV95549.1 hypothetical protein SEVIR_9G371100v2 [Setaria viridis]TKV95550.1 hypothetical protein SEVIR_9G371100v2 [Setaria viridis]
MAKASAETNTTALFFSFSAVVLLLLALQPPDRRPGGGTLADLLLAALDRFPDARGLLDLATRRNMVLLCHAILLVILRNAGILGAPARRRGATATTASAVVADAADAGACCAPVLTDAAERSIVVWRRPRGGAKQDAHADGSGHRLVRRRQARRSAQQHPAAAAAPIPRAVPALAEQPEQQQPPLTSKEIVLVDHDRAAAVVELHMTSASTTDGEKSDGRDVDTAAEETPELADDRRIEEFIAKQWSKIRHESLQLDRSSGSQSQAITTC